MAPFPAAQADKWRAAPQDKNAFPYEPGRQGRQYESAFPVRRAWSKDLWANKTVDFRQNYSFDDRNMIA